MYFNKSLLLPTLLILTLQVSYGSSTASALDSQDWADIIEIGTTILGNDGNNGSDSSLERDVNSDEGGIDVYGNDRNRFPCLDNHNTVCYTGKQAWSDYYWPSCDSEDSKQKLIINNVNSRLQRIRTKPKEKREQKANELLKSSADALSLAKRQPMDAPMRKFSIYQVAEKKLDMCQTKLAVLRYRRGQLEDWDPFSAKTINNSNSGTSIESNSNQQTTNSQSNQSKADELGKLSLNNAVDQFNIADRQKDYAKAFPLLEIIVAKSQDKQEKASAINKLGEYYKFGDGVLKDEVKAQALFEQASMMGETDADAQICHNYLNGIGVTENHQTAIKYCTTAANRGLLIPMAQLGWIYATGTGTQNEQLAKEWTCKAAQKGHAGSIQNAKILNFNCN